MDTLVKIFGQAGELNTIQMSCRGVVLFFIALVLIRISGRRSFGIRGPLDNIITILLGAILSRAVVGATPFVPVIVTGLVIVLLHRWISWLITSNDSIAKIVQGQKILLYQDGEFIERNMKRALLNHEDVMHAIRRSVLTEDMSRISKIYIERSGEITAVKKDD
jgi:uncharacterized membrane protein YcaP (DUF421 family)